MLRFFFIFLGILTVLFGIELLGPVQKYFVMPWTGMLASFSASLIQFFDADVTSHANIIQNAANGFGVAIMPGCNGVEACIILTAALLAFSAPWQPKLIGVGIGIFAVQAVNILRIISLFYLGQWNMKWFEFAHLYLWQGLIILDVLVVWLLWVHHLTRRGLIQVAISHAA